MQTAFQPISVHKLEPALWEKNRRKLRSLNLAVVFGPVLSVVAVYALIGNLAWHDTRRGLTTILLLGCLCMVGWFFALGRIERAEKRYYSFELFVMPEGLLRRQLDVPDLYIPFNTIATLEIVAEKGAMVRIQSSNNFLWIADELIGYADVCSLLRQHAAKYVESAAMPWFNRPWLLMPFSIGSILAIMVSSNLTAVLAATPVFLACLSSDVIRAKHSPAITKEQKRNLLFMPVLVIAVVLRILYVWLVLRR